MERASLHGTLFPPPPNVQPRPLSHDALSTPRRGTGRVMGKGRRRDGSGACLAGNRLIVGRLLSTRGAVARPGGSPSLAESKCRRGARIESPPPFLPEGGMARLHRELSAAVLSWISPSPGEGQRVSPVERGAGAVASPPPARSAVGLLTPLSIKQWRKRFMARPRPRGPTGWAAVSRAPRPGTVFASFEIDKRVLDAAIRPGSPATPRALTDTRRLGQAPSSCLYFPTPLSRSEPRLQLVSRS